MNGGLRRYGRDQMTALKLRPVAINPSADDMQGLFVKVPAAAKAATAEAGFLIEDDCLRLWPRSFNGDLYRAAEALRAAGLKSARVECDWVA